MKWGKRLFKIMHLLASQGNGYTVLWGGCYTFVPVDLIEVYNFNTKVKDTAEKPKLEIWLILYSLDFHCLAVDGIIFLIGCRKCRCFQTTFQSLVTIHLLVVLTIAFIISFSRGLGYCSLTTNQTQKSKGMLIITIA